MDGAASHEKTLTLRALQMASTRRTASQLGAKQGLLHWTRRGKVGKRGNGRRKKIARSQAEKIGQRLGPLLHPPLRSCQPARTNRPVSFYPSTVKAYGEDQSAFVNFLSCLLGFTLIFLSFPVLPTFPKTVEHHSTRLQSLIGRKNLWNILHRK